MKSFLFLFGLIKFVVSGPLAFEQVSISQKTSYPGFTLDLNDRRLVQFEGQEPKWLTELEKVLIIIFVDYIFSLLFRFKPKLKA